MLDGTRAGHRLRVMNSLAVALGVAAGVFLALLANITLDDDSEVHEIYSIVFFATQVGAFVIDTLLTRRLRQRAAVQGLAPGVLFFGTRSDLKTWICWVITADALLFLGVFLEREVELFADRRLLLEIYTAAEFSIAILAFAYAAAYYRQAHAFAAACRAGLLFTAPAAARHGSPASVR
jgi:hypothetical protein